MAQAVWDSVTDGTHLAVQAGTGTGKSLAYLVPAMQLAANKRGPVVVSTPDVQRYSGCPGHLLLSCRKFLMSSSVTLSFPSVS